MVAPQSALAQGCFDGFGDGRRYVGAYVRPSGRCGVLTEEQAGVCPSLKPLALDAEKELTELRGTVKEEKLTRIAALVEAAMQ